MTTIENMIKEKQSIIVDVRSILEFISGHAEGSVNIPLHEIPQRLDELKNFKKPLILCCASGNRSAQATGYLSQQGFECYNGGSWHDVSFIQLQNN